MKPENIILRPDTGLIKLIDFGAATSLNAPTKFRGTRQYASPEILFTKTINPIAADMWASGVTLYKMLMGHLPFQSNKDYYTPLRFTRPDLSKDCVKIISNVLHPIAIQRPGSIGDVMSCPWLKWCCQKVKVVSYWNVIIVMIFSDDIYLWYLFNLFIYDIYLRMIFIYAIYLCYLYWK